MINSSTMNMIIVISYFVLSIPISYAANLNQSFMLLRDITLIGDSYFRNGVIGLTGEIPVPSTTTSGAVIYNPPIKLFNPQTNTTASIYSRFRFSVSRLNNPTSFNNDHLAFFLSADSRTVRSPGLSFELIISSPDSLIVREVAVELDTNPLDSTVNHPICHSLVSPIFLEKKSGNVVTSWIDYRHEVGLLRIFLSSSPLNPVLSTDIDLSTGNLEEGIFFGFSASAESSSTVMRLVGNWTIQNSGFPKTRQQRLHPLIINPGFVSVLIMSFCAIPLCYLAYELYYALYIELYDLPFVPRRRSTRVRQNWTEYIPDEERLWYLVNAPRLQDLVEENLRRKRAEDERRVSAPS